MSDRLSIIQLGTPGEEISFSDLRAVVNRFKRLHHAKRENIRHILNLRQRQFLDTLPLMLDINHPALPGFISSSTPAGIFAYQPDDRTLEAARKLNRSFHYQRPKREQSPPAIEALFLMGSVGSIAFTRASDMDIWLCHRSDLTKHELDELRKKTRAIENWAASLQLEVHFFLINDNQFPLSQKKPVSADSSGETQHYLLLEEFYRTSIYIAGKSLAWWLVPPELEIDYKNYLAHLLERRFIDSNQILDLGGLAHIPASEFISATQWHAYKALHSPYKSLLKLSLIECYASEYPNINWLSVEVKRAVYQGELTGPRVDPYVLLYRKLEDYYLHKSQSTERLELIRQFFYLKINETSAPPRQAGHHAHYKNYFQELFAGWNWPNFASNFPDEQNFPNIERLLNENARIINQLTLCYSKIIQLVYEHIDSDFQKKTDMKLLARKLKAFLERKQGKIEIMTTTGNGLPIPPGLTIIEDRSDMKSPGWSLRYEKKDYHDDVPVQTILYRRQTLIEILCWLSINHIYRQGIPIHCDAESINLSSAGLSRHLGRLDSFFKRYFDFSDSLDNYADPNSLAHSLLIINIGLTSKQTETDTFIISPHDNPLSHGISRECLIKTVDRVSITHWNEILTGHTQGIEGLCDYMVEIINETLLDNQANLLEIVCDTPNHGRNIIRRLEKLFEDLRELHRADQANSTPRYLMAGGDRYFVFSRKNGLLHYQIAEDEARLNEMLSSPRKLYGSITFDPVVLQRTPIPAIYRQNRPHTVQCFIYRGNNDIWLYILDEKGSLYIRRHSDTTTAQLVSQYARFLHSLLSRKTVEAASMQFYALEKDAETVWHCRPLHFHLTKDHEQYPLSISGACLNNADVVTVRWNGEEFSSQQYGDRLFQTVSEKIIEFRKNEQTYPVYITELDLLPSAFGLGGTTGLQTLHFLEYKEKVEAKINGKR